MARSRRCATSIDLPNYGVFDEKRVFQPGPAPGPISFKGVRLGVPICEDIWTDETCETLAETGAEILLVPNGSPFERNKDDVRLNLVVARVTETGLPMAYLNQVCGQDELVFDGASFVLNADRSLALQMPMFEEDDRAHRMAARGRTAGAWCRARSPSCRKARKKPGRPACWASRDYVVKNRFPGVVLGLSGGIDSAVVAAMAVDALGKDTRALRDAALCLYQPRQPGRCRGLRQGCWACATTWCRSRSRSKDFSRR